MSKKKDKGIVGIAVKVGGELLNNEKVKKTILGEYTDGKTRSIVDAISGEYLSPHTKKKHDKHNKKKKKHPEKYKLNII